MVNPNELIKKFPLRKWYGKDKDTVMTVKLTADEMCFLFAQLGFAIHMEELNTNVALRNKLNFP